MLPHRCVPSQKNEALKSICHSVCANLVHNVICVAMCAQPHTWVTYTVCSNLLFESWAPAHVLLVGCFCSHVPSHPPPFFACGGAVAKSWWNLSILCLLLLVLSTSIARKSFSMRAKASFCQKARIVVIFWGPSQMKYNGYQ